MKLLYVFPAVSLLYTALAPLMIPQENPTTEHQRIHLERLSPQGNYNYIQLVADNCQCRSKIPQKRRLKFPQSAG